MAVTKEEVVEFIANMTVLELSEFIKELEEKFGVSAAAPAAAMMVAPFIDAERTFNVAERIFNVAERTFSVDERRFNIAEYRKV